MASVFRGDLCLPFLFYECLQEFSSEGMTEDSVLRAGEVTFGEQFSKTTIPAIIARLIEEAEKGVNASDSGYRPKTKQVFGTSLSDYLSSLDGEQLCFFLADFDPVLARKLYCEVDMRVVMTAAKEKMGYTAELSGVWFEAVLFGMGGSYKGNGPKDEVIDLSADANAGRAQLKKLGLM